MSRARLAPAALVAVVLLAGCGSSSPSSSPSGGPAATSSPTLVVQAASDATAKAGSARFEQKTVASVGGKDLTTTAQGSFDPATRRGQIDISLDGGTGQAGETLQERVLGDDLYISDPQQAGTFYKLALADLVGTSFASGADPTAGFQALKAASSGVTEVGGEQVRGVATTHYRGTFDESAALEKVSGAVKDLLTSAFKGSDLSAVPFDAWVDDQGRLRRVVQQLTVTTSGQKVTSTSTTEVFDFGTEVSASAPPAAQVKDGAPLIAALKSATTG